MTILFVTAGTKRAAATRYRVSQYLPFLEERGIKYKVFSITSDFMTHYMIKSPEMNFFNRLVYYIFFLTERFVRSWFVILKAASYDRIFLQRVTFPLKLERLLSRRNANIIFDIDDAIFMPDLQKNDLLTRLKSFIKEKEVKAVLKISKCVIVENEYIKNYVLQFCPHVYKIPGPIDTNRYFVKDKTRKNNIVIGWIGSPATTSYLGILDNVFIKILEKYPDVSLHLIGVGNYPLNNRRVRRIPWSYDTEITELQKFDVGLMSMPDNEWTRGKLGCKMLQYMALGIPTVCSDTETNREIIINGVSGFLVKTENEWFDALSKLIDSYELRIRLGRNARNVIEEKCSINRNLPLLIQLLNNPAKI